MAKVLHSQKIYERHLFTYMLLSRRSMAKADRSLPQPNLE